MELRTLNLDDSLPSSPTFGSPSGTVRFLTLADEFSLPAFSRVHGDLAWRDQLLQGKVNEIVGSLNSNPNFAGFNPDLYILASGANALQGPLSSPAPTHDSHLVNREFLQEAITGAKGEITGVTDGLSDRIETVENNATTWSQSGWTEHEWQADTRTITDLMLATPVNRETIVSIQIFERLDISVPSEAEPDPPSIYRYRLLVPGSRTGFRIDDIWVHSTTVVRVLIPNTQSFEVYPSEADYAHASPRSRFLRAVVGFL